MATIEKFGNEVVNGALPDRRREPSLLNREIDYLPRRWREDAVETGAAPRRLLDSLRRSDCGDESNRDNPE